MPVRIFHNRYAFVKIPDTVENHRNIYKMIEGGFILLYGYISLGHARIKTIEFNEENRILILRVDSRFLNHLITVLKYISLKNNMNIEFIGSSTTLRKGRRRFIG